MRKDEARGLLRAAKRHGLAGEDLEVIEKATEQPIKMEDVDVTGLDPWGRLFTYALANWLAKLDGVVNTEELASLRALADQVDLPDPKLQAARSAVMDILVLPEGNRPEKYDFDALEARLQEKLPALYRSSVPPT